MNHEVDRKQARRHLALANKLVFEGEQRIAAQAALVAGLERDGHNVFQAKSLLEQFEQTIAILLESRDRLVEVLDDKS